MTRLDVTQDPYNAVPDGETDNRAAIQQAIDDAADGDVVYLPAGEYGIDEWSDDPHWGSCLYVGQNKEGVSFTIEGDGQDSVLVALSGENMLSIPVGEADSGKIDLDVRNLVFDGKKDSGRAIDINQGWSNSGVERRSAGHSLHFENVLIQNTGATAFQMRGDDAADVGVGTVTAKNLTVKNTYDGHGISLTSAVQTDTKSEVNNIFDSVKCVNIGSDTNEKGNGINCDGSHLVRNFWFEDCKRGSKISGGGTNSFFENGTFANNTETDQSAFRETIAGDWNDPWTVQMDNVRFDTISTSAYRMGGRDDQPGKTIFGEVEFNNIDEGGPEDDFVMLFEDVHDLTAETIHVYNSGGDFPTYDWQGSELRINELNTDSQFGGLDSNYDVGTWNEGVSSTTLDVPAKEEVGAFSGSGGSTDDGGDEETDSGDDTTQPPLFDDWTPQWGSSQDDWRVVSGSEYVGGYALAFEHDGTDRTRYALAWDQLGELADVEIVDKFRVPEFTSDSNLGFHSRVHLRSSGSSGSENGYWLEVEAPQNAFRLAKYTNEDLTTLGRFETPEENTFFYRRFRAEGTQLKAKVWPVGESEPSAWDIETTDEDHAQGWVGLGSFDTELVETDVFSVATGGETAPLPGAGSPDDAPELSWVAPTDGATVSGSTTIQIDANDAEDDAESLLVEYRLDDGSWAAASYNTETGYYEASWDTTTVSNGDHSLEASVTDSAGNATTAAITVTTDNTSGQPSIDSLSLSEVETDSSDAEFDATWQASDTDGDLATADLVLFQDSDGTREDELSVDISGDAAGETTRLVASGDDGSANSYTVELTVTDGDGNTASGANSTTETEDTGSAPVINRFSVSEAGRPDPHAEVTALWDVTDTDGNLETVDIEVSDSNGTVQGVSWTLSGSSAADTDSFKIKEGDGQSFDVTITVTDASGKSSSETKSVSA